MADHGSHGGGHGSSGGGKGIGPIGFVAVAIALVMLISDASLVGRFILAAVRGNTDADNTPTSVPYPYQPPTPAVAQAAAAAADADDASDHTPKVDGAGAGAATTAAAQSNQADSAQTNGYNATAPGIPNPVAPARPNGNAGGQTTDNGTAATPTTVATPPCKGADGLLPQFAEGDFVMTVEGCTEFNNEIQLSGTAQYTGIGRTRMSFGMMHIKDARGVDYTITRGTLGKKSCLGTDIACDTYLSSSESVDFEIDAKPEEGKGITPFIFLDVPVIIHESNTPIEVNFKRLTLQNPTAVPVSSSPATRPKRRRGNFFIHFKYPIITKPLAGFCYLFRYNNIL